MDQTEAEPIPQSLRILWVDDESSVVDLIQIALKEDLGWEVETFDSAKNALASLEKRAEENNLPDIIVSDFGMPLMNGLEFAQVIRSHQDERIRSLPFCLASGLPFTKEELKTFEELNVFVLDKVKAVTQPQKIREFWEKSREG